jgi:hypothetical protein
MSCCSLWLCLADRMSLQSLYWRARQQRKTQSKPRYLRNKHKFGRSWKFLSKLGASPTPSVRLINDRLSHAVELREHLRDSWLGPHPLGAGTRRRRRARCVPDRRVKEGAQRSLTDNRKWPLNCNVLVRESMTSQFPS